MWWQGHLRTHVHIPRQAAGGMIRSSIQINTQRALRLHYLEGLWNYDTVRHVRLSRLGWG